MLGTEILIFHVASMMHDNLYLWLHEDMDVDDNIDEMEIDDDINVNMEMDIFDDMDFDKEIDDDMNINMDMNVDNDLDLEMEINDDIVSMDIDKYL